ncbi:recombinase family protein [Paenibacillus apii]|uniref:recombinase family protein n=1 Tax=Paenibacillus apii TaxID=1850370 RepID=UPI00143BEC0C|nr:recombinase family protein [Paenibacillus apii]NJJ38587.1 recombinase family protein [Paenibacillus apii]
MVSKADGTPIGGLRVAIYTRVSTDHQAEEGFSLEVQHEKLIEYINRNKLQLFKFYSDPGVSAKDLNRPGIKELLRDFEDDMFDIILVHKLDRLTRNIGDLHRLVEMVNAKKKKLISYTEDIDTSTPSGRMFVYFLGIISQLFRENLGEEVTKGMRKRAQKGLHNITVDLYGYKRTEDGDLLIKDEEANWVRWIFEKYASGIGSPTIAKQLNKMGIRRNKGSKWDHSKVMLTLNNKHYLGKVHSKFTRDEEPIVREGKHEAIISDELYERVQRVLERKREGLISPNSQEYIFGGIVKCGVCGATYTGITDNRSSYPLRHYKCANKSRFGTCNQGGLSEKKLTDLVFKSVNIIGKEYTRKDMPQPTKSEEDEIRSAIRASEERRERWQLAYGDGNMPYEDFAKRMKEEMNHMAELELKLSTIPKKTVSYLTPSEAVNTINELKNNWDYLEQGTRKEIMQSLFQKISILKEEETWRITEVILA